MSVFYERIVWCLIYWQWYVLIVVNTERPGIQYTCTVDVCTCYYVTWATHFYSTFLLRFMEPLSWLKETSDHVCVCVCTCVCAHVCVSRTCVYRSSTHIAQTQGVLISWSVRNTYVVFERRGRQAWCYDRGGSGRHQAPTVTTHINPTSLNPLPWVNNWHCRRSFGGIAASIFLGRPHWLA